MLASLAADKSVVQRQMVVRPARPLDMIYIEPLINSWAAKGVMLSKSPDHLMRSFREFVVAHDAENVLSGCGALRVYSPQLAEISSLAVPEFAHGRGVGRNVVEHLEAQAGALGIGTLFALTLEAGFFLRLGYRIVSKEMFPLKVWADCKTCPKLNACDEIAVVKEI